MFRAEYSCKMISNATALQLGTQLLPDRHHLEAAAVRIKPGNAAT